MSYFARPNYVQTRFTFYILLCVVWVLPMTAFSQLHQADCRPGFFAAADRCRPCPQGTYQFRSNASSCLPCPPGTFSNIRGAQGRDICLPCPSGTFSNVSGQSTCIPCPQGTNSPSGALICSSCPPGEQPLPDAPMCEPCPGNTFTSESNSPSCAPCPLGSLSSNNATSCVPCPVGTFLTSRRRGRDPPVFECRRCRRQNGLFNNASFVGCEQCPFAQTPNRDTTSCIPCRPGFAAVSFGSGRCQRCQPGENMGTRGAFICLPPNTPCPSNYFRTTTGACINCNKGERYVSSENTCVPCGENEESDGGVSKRCRRCGRFQIRSPMGCICQRGAELTDDRNCRPCLAGHSHNAITGRCDFCPDGFFAANRGSTECTKCPEGTASQPDRKGCRECRRGQVLRVGSPVISIGRRTTTELRGDVGTCVVGRTNCPPGMVRENGDDGGLAICRARRCPSGTFARAFPADNATRFETGFMCISCRRGQFFDGMVCRNCGRGQISEGGLVRSCTACGENEILQSRAASGGRLEVRCGCGRGFGRNEAGECVLCGEGMVSTRVLFGDARCVRCGPGTRVLFSSCTPCLPGSFSTGGARFCPRCEEGFTSGLGSESCVEIGSLM